MAHQETTQHLSIHALGRVRAEDGFVGASVDVVRIVRSSLEVVAFVVTGENRTRR